MQTTLLGVAIAFIVALVAALVGPVFIDWNEFRPRFEAEATRALGVQVRVAGPLDARLLPVPSLRLKSVSIGGANDPGRLRADGFDVDLSLGALMRGEILATELSISGVSLDLGLDGKGQIDWPAGGQLNLRRLAIERLNVTGRIALHDAASRSTVELNDIAFSGDVRPQAGALRGDGNFVVTGTRYPFRIATSANEQGGTRLKLAVDAADISAAGEVDGVLMLDDRQPRFDGTLQLVRIAGAKADKGDTRPPWKMTTKLKADPARAMFEQLEWGRGADDAQKLTGSGEMRFGAEPLLRASLTAKSLDAAQWIGAENSGKPAATALPRLVDALGDLPPLPFVANISLGADQIMLGGKPVQNAVLNVATSGDKWRLTRLDFRGPGATRVTLGGAFTPAAGSQFEGKLDLASNDPDSFVTWLQGRNSGGAQFQKPLRVQGNLKFGPLAVVLDDINAEIDGGALKGRIAWAQPDAGPSKLGVALQGDRVDLDQAFAMVRASLGPQGSWPASGDVALDFANAVAGGQAMSPFGVSFSYDADRMTLERLRVGEASGITIDGSGAFDRKTTSGTLALSGATPSLTRLVALLAPSSPAISSRLSALTAKDGPARLNLTLGLDSDAAKPDRARARASLGIEAAPISGTISLTASPSAQAIRALDLESLQRGELGLESRLTALRGDALTKLLGIEHLADAGSEPLSLESSITGAWNAPLRGMVKLSGKILDADVQGSAEPWADPRAASLRLAVRKANITPMLGLANGASQTISSFASKLTIAGNAYSFEGIDGTVGGARLRGRVVASLAEPRTLDGEIGLDRLDLALVYAYAIGAAGHDPGEPLRAGPLAGWRTKLSFVALRGVLPGDVELQPLSAVLRGDGSGLALESIKARLGGGEITGTAELRPGAAGVTLALQAQTSDIDATALRYRGLKLPEGKATVKLSLTSQGRSAAALASATSGEGVLTLSNARIAGLDNKAFDAAVTAFDLSLIANDSSLRKVVEQSLANGELSIASAQIPFAITDGRLRVNATPLEAPNARAIVSGGYDFAADQADIRAILTAPNLLGAGNTPPELQVFAVGPPDRMMRTIDVSPLSSWLAIRAIDRETRRLDALEREAPTAALTSPAAKPADASPLPADPPVAAPKVRIEPRVVPNSPMLAPEANAQGPQPLPPAIQVGPPPGTPRVVRPQPSPPRPLSLVPPASVQRPAF